MSNKKLIRTVFAIAGLMLAITGCERLSSSDISSAQRVKIEAIVHDYLVKNPQVLLEASQALQQQHTNTLQEKIAEVVPLYAAELFHDVASPVVGDSTSNIAIVEFFDYQCPHCKTMMPVLEQLLQKNPQLHLVFKQLPILGSTSELAAKAALAAMQQGKFLSVHRALMTTDQPLTQDLIWKLAQQQGVDILKLKKNIQEKDNFMALKQTFILADAMGIHGTPAFVIASGVNQPDPKKIRVYFIPGGTGLASFQKIIDQLEKSSVSP